MSAIIVHVFGCSLDVAYFHLCRQAIYIYIISHIWDILPSPCSACTIAVPGPPHRPCLARYTHDNYSVVHALQDARKMIRTSCRHFKTAALTSWHYRARPSRCWQHSYIYCALLPHFPGPRWSLKSCRHRTDIVRCLHQAGTIPARRHLSTPQPCDACDFKKMFNSALDCGRRRISNYRSCRPAGPVELHDHRKKLRENPPQRSCRSIVGHLWPRH